MITLFRGRQYGKTTDLIKLSAKNNVNIACADKMRLEYITETAEQLKLEIPKPFILNKNTNLDEYDKIYIDDIEIVINNLLDGKIKGITSGYYEHVRDYI